MRKSGSMACIGMVAALSVVGAGAVTVCPNYSPEEAAKAEENQRYNAALLEHLRESTEPRNWALASQLTSPYAAAGSGSRESLLRDASAAAPTDTLVLWMAANLRVADNGSCCLSDAVGSLLAAEPDNGAAWLLKLDSALQSRDDAAIDDVLMRIASAAHFDTHEGDALKAWHKVYSDFGLPPEYAATTDVDSRDQALFLMAISLASSAIGPHLTSMVKACDLAAQPPSHSALRAGLCEDLGRHLTAVSKSLLGARFGLSILRKADRYSEKDANQERELDWLAENLANASDTMSPRTYHQFLADWLELGDERQVMSRLMNHLGLDSHPPEGWVSATQRFRLAQREEHGPTRVIDAMVVE